MRIVLAEYYVTEDRTLLFVGRSDFEEPRVVAIERSRSALRSFTAANYTAADGIGVDADMVLLAGVPRSLCGTVAAIRRSRRSPVVRPARCAALRSAARPVAERRTAHRPPSRLLRAEFLGDALLPGKTKGSRRTALVMGDSRDDLPHAREEALSSAIMFAVKPHLGADVTKSLVQHDLDEQDIDVIHVACHGSFDAQDPLASRILLHGESDLTARDIFGLRLRADLVTLSACQTAVNERRPGDELIGLTRALIFAGTPSAVVSLWSVDDMSTGFLMRTFYRLLLGSGAAHRRPMPCARPSESCATPVSRPCSATATSGLAAAADEDRRSWLRLERADILAAGFDFDAACAVYAEELARAATVAHGGGPDAGRAHAASTEAAPLPGAARGRAWPAARPGPAAVRAPLLLGAVSARWRLEVAGHGRDSAQRADGRVRQVQAHAVAVLRRVHREGVQGGHVRRGRRWRGRDLLRRWLRRPLRARHLRPARPVAGRTAVRRARAPSGRLPRARGGGHGQGRPRRDPDHLVPERQRRRASPGHLPL